MDTIRDVAAMDLAVDSSDDRWSGYLTFENGPEIERRLTQLLTGKRLAIVNSCQVLHRFRPELTVDGALVASGVKFAETPAFDSAVLTIEFAHMLLVLHTTIRDRADWHARPEKHRSTPHFRFTDDQVAISWSVQGDVYHAVIGVIAPL